MVTHTGQIVCYLLLCIFISYRQRISVLHHMAFELVIFDKTRKETAPLAYYKNVIRQKTAALLGGLVP